MRTGRQHAPVMTFARIIPAAVLSLLALTACSTGSTGGAGSSSDGGPLTVVAAENFWGSIAAQVGGDDVEVTSIIDSPDADPHDYEPTAADGRAVATADLVLVNGVGYDTWATKLVDANPADGRTVLTVGELVGAKDDGNPHLWYDPTAVDAVIDQLVADYKKLDPDNAAGYDASAASFREVGLGKYTSAIASIKKDHSGTKVGASESIFAMLAPSLGLDLITPPSFLAAISEGNDPTASDKRTVDEQITGKKIAVYVVNSQNSTPDVQAQVRAAKAAGIPVVAITETLTPAGASFQDWQTAQLVELWKQLDVAAGAE